MDAINNNKINQTSTSKLGSINNYLENNIRMPQTAKLDNVSPDPLKIHQELGNKGNSVYTLA